MNIKELASITTLNSGKMSDHHSNHFFKSIICCFVLVTALFTTSCCQKQEISVETLLNEMVSFDNQTLYPEPYYTCKQMSSYDRRSVSSGQPGWFANDDGFGVISADTVGDIVRQVLFDEEGPGAITRIWITTSNKQ